MVFQFLFSSFHNSLSLHKTEWTFSNANYTMVLACGNLQQIRGCKGIHFPACPSSQFTAYACLTTVSFLPFPTVLSNQALQFSTELLLTFSLGSQMPRKLWPKNITCLLPFLSTFISFMFWCELLTSLFTCSWPCLQCSYKGILVNFTTFL